MSDAIVRQGGQVFDQRDYVSVDGTTLQGGGVASDPLRAALSISRFVGEAFPIGTPVYLDVTLAGWFAKKARANAAATSRVLGLAQQASLGGEAEQVKVQFGSVLELTAAQWGAVKEDAVAGLVPNSYYYLSSAAAGKLTTTPPVGAGTFVKPVGYAASVTEMVIQLEATQTSND